MARKKPIDESVPLPIHQIVTFIEAKTFTDAWHDLGLPDESLRELQLLVMLDPQKAPVISGTGGLRKLRFAPRAWAVGKRGALRVCYAAFPDYHVVLLVLVYAKNEKDTLTPSEKKTIREFLERVRQGLAE